MHLVFQGAVKRLLDYLLKGPAIIRLSEAQKLELSRCLAKGEYTVSPYPYKKKVMTFTQVDAELRTDEDFQDLRYMGKCSRHEGRATSVLQCSDCRKTSHQLAKTSLIKFGIPCVSFFILDIMHLVFQGAVKRLLDYLLKGPAIIRLSGA